MKDVSVEQKDGELSLKLFIVLSRALESIKKQVMKDVKKYGLNLTEFGVLEFLYHKGEQPIQIIGKKVLLASSSITYVVDKLEEKNLLERISCPQDRRVIYGKLSNQGEKLMAEIFPQHEKAIATIFSSLSVEEKEQAIELIKRVGIFAESM